MQSRNEGDLKKLYSFEEANPDIITKKIQVEKWKTLGPILNKKKAGMKEISSFFLFER